MVNWKGDTSPLSPLKVSFPLPFIIQVVSFNVSVKCRLSPIKRVHVRGEEDINTLCDLGISNHVSIEEDKFMKQLLKICKIS